MAADVNVEVVFATTERQRLVAITLPPGATVADAIQASGIAKDFPGEDVTALPVGVWGRVVSPDRRVNDGDRVEIYRPLVIDPRTARRQLAALGQTMADKR